MVKQKFEDALGGNSSSTNNNQLRAVKERQGERRSNERGNDRRNIQKSSLELYKRENERLLKEKAEQVIPFAEQVVYYLALIISFTTIITLMSYVALYGHI